MSSGRGVGRGTTRSQTGTCESLMYFNYRNDKYWDRKGYNRKVHVLKRICTVLTHVYLSVIWWYLQ